MSRRKTRSTRGRAEARTHVPAPSHKLRFEDNSSFDDDSLPRRPSRLARWFLAIMLLLQATWLGFLLVMALWG